jgi:heterodisulfide reductase subunit A-like polyferredoxin
MAGLINSRQPESEICFFYVDIQTFGKDFVFFYRRIREKVRLRRAIPGDIFETPEGQLRVFYVTHDTHEPTEEIFDCVVLSAGLQPCNENFDLFHQLNLKGSDSNFIDSAEINNVLSSSGVFTAGAVGGPMSIAESIASAGETAHKILNYLDV